MLRFHSFHKDLQLAVLENEKCASPVLAYSTVLNCSTDVTTVDAVEWPASWSARVLTRHRTAAAGHGKDPRWFSEGWGVKERAGWKESGGKEGYGEWSKGIDLTWQGYPRTSEDGSVQPRLLDWSWLKNSFSKNLKKMLTISTGEEPTLTIYSHSPLLGTIQWNAHTFIWKLSRKNYGTVFGFPQNFCFLLEVLWFFLLLEMFGWIKRLKKVHRSSKAMPKWWWVHEEVKNTK